MHTHARLVLGGQAPANDGLVAVARDHGTFVRVEHEPLQACLSPQDWGDSMEGNGVEEIEFAPAGVGHLPPVPAHDNEAGWHAYLVPAGVIVMSRNWRKVASSCS